MSSDLTRRSLMGAAILAAAGCGFAPAFGTDGSAAELRGRVAVTAPETATGFRLRARIDDRLGFATVPRYALSVSIDQTREAATVSQGGDTLRFQLIGVADWTLRMGTTTILDGQARAFTSYAATGSTVGTQTAAADAADRLADLLAEEIIDDLILAAPDLP